MSEMVGCRPPLIRASRLMLRSQCIKRAAHLHISLRLHYVPPQRFRALASERRDKKTIELEYFPT
jgi:hypothetical protein